MNAINVVITSCACGNLQSALDAHQVLFSSGNRAATASSKETASVEDHAYAQKLGCDLHQSACMIQGCFDVEVKKFPV